MSQPLMIPGHPYWDARIDGGRILLPDGNLPGHLRDMSDLHDCCSAIEEQELQGTVAIVQAAAYGLAAHCWNASRNQQALARAWDEAWYCLSRLGPGQTALTRVLTHLRDCYETHEALLDEPELAARMILEARRLDAEQERCIQSLAAQVAPLLASHSRLLALGHHTALLGACLARARQLRDDLEIYLLHTTSRTPSPLASFCKQSNIPHQSYALEESLALLADGDHTAIALGVEGISDQGDCWACTPALAVAEAAGKSPVIALATRLCYGVGPAREQGLTRIPGRLLDQRYTETGLLSDGADAYPSWSPSLI